MMRVYKQGDQLVSDSDSIDEASAQIAIGAFTQQVQSLSSDDKADILDLFLSIPDALARGNKSEFQEITALIAEILSGEDSSDGVCVEEMPLPASEENEESGPPTQWKAFISDKIKSERESRNWTQAELANKA